MNVAQVKRIYVPLPDAEARKVLLKNLLKGEDFALQGKTDLALVDSWFGSMFLCVRLTGHWVL